MRNSNTSRRHSIPDWAVRFHTHLCPCLVMGYRMGAQALAWLGVTRDTSKGLLILPELGEGHPQTCMVDGMRIATGATYGQLLMTKTYYGKLAATFFHPGRGAVRYALRPEFVDALESLPFYDLRRECRDVAEIPQPLLDQVLDWLDEQSSEFMFKIEPVVGFPYRVVVQPFAKTRCVVCGEYVLDASLRFNDHRPYCASCLRQVQSAS